MDVVPRDGEMVTTFRDSAVGMPTTNDTFATAASTECVLNNGKDAGFRANKSVSEEDDPKESDEITYEVRYVNAIGEHLHSRPLKRRAHDFEQPVLTQTPVM